MTSQFFCRTARLATFLAAAFAAALTAIPACAADQHGHHEHHANAKDIADFHTALAPLWHAPAGKARIDNACAQAATLDKLARDIKSSNAAALQEAVGLFKQKCQTAPSEAQAVFGKVHDAFHQVSAHKE